MKIEPRSKFIVAHPWRAVAGTVLAILWLAVLLALGGLLPLRIF